MSAAADRRRRCHAAGVDCSWEWESEEAMNEGWATQQVEVSAAAMWSSEVLLWVACEWYDSTRLMAWVELAVGVEVRWR